MRWKLVAYIFSPINIFQSWIWTILLEGARNPVKMVYFHLFYNFFRHFCFLCAYKLELELESGFVYWTLLGEMMYAYVTCRSGIAYAITKMSKFSTKPSAKHYYYLKGIAKYLCLTITRDWSIKFKRTAEHPELDDSKFQPNVVLDPNLFWVYSRY